MKTCEHCGGLIATENLERIAGTPCRCGMAPTPGSAPADCEPAPPPGNGYAPPLHWHVAYLERREEDLSLLCGQILATLEINFARKTLTTADDPQFQRFLDAWQRRYKRAGKTDEQNGAG